MIRSAGVLLIVIAVAGAAGRILSAHLVFETNVGRKWETSKPRPMASFSSNDRSRWATVRAIVDKGTFEVGQREPTAIVSSMALSLAAEHPLQAATLAQAGYFYRTSNDRGIIFEDGWKSVDKVMDPATLKFYSSKPPLLSVLIAGVYWLLKTLFGWNLGDMPGAPGQPDEVIRTTLLLVNAVPFAIYLVVLARIGQRYARSEWSQLLVLAAAAFGTMVTPFLITLNNHTLAVFSVLWAVAHLLCLWERKQSGKNLPWLHFAGAGFWAAFTVCNEMPGLAFWAALFGVAFLIDRRRALAFFVPPGLVLGAAFFLTNYWALGRWTPVQASFGSPWYEFEGSHFRRPEPGEVKTGIDWAGYRETRGEYALHLLVGHHGFFALTPLWIIALAGIVWWLRRRAYETPPATGPPADSQAEATPAVLPLPWWLPWMTLALSVVVIGFYLIKSDNYGGWTNGPRWLMWLTPLLLVCLYPVLDRLGECKWSRGLAYAALGLSILAANYRPWNPWRHPWLYDALVWLGWPGY